MKTEDFERLKEICEKEGFELSLDAVEGYNQEYVFRVSKKDPWEGVEFIIPNHNSSASKFPYKVVSKNNGFFQIYCPYSGNGGIAQIQTNEVNPSTEQAYFEQLKKTAYEKFGEIKEGDRFDLTPISICFSNHVKIRKTIFEYDKIEDSFSVDDFIIYQQGKWATKLTERVEVKLLRERYGDYPEFKFKIINGKVDYYDSYKIGQYLANQLENYLNDETETKH